MSNYWFLTSSNGLVCISPYAAQFLVTNPSTREVKNLATLDGVPQKYRRKLCWGFGYDFSIDDYKLVVGIRKGAHRTRFQVLTLRSNVWRLLGDVNYSFSDNFTDGVFCNGALHWFMNDHDDNKDSKIIISFDLSLEEFKEIPQPDDTRYVCQFFSYVGIMEECLCIFTSDNNPTWVMKSYNVKQSWKMLPKDPDTKYDIRRPLKCISPLTSWSLCDDKDDQSSFGWRHVGAPIFVKSLVSPHLNRKQKKNRRAKINKASVRRVSSFDVISRSFLFSCSIIYRKRKRRSTNIKRNDKLIKGHTSAPRTSAEV